MSRAPLVAFLAITAAACTHEAPAPVVAPPPPPKMVWSKPGATNEEFQRASAGCLMRAEIAESQSTDPNPLARSGTFALVFPTCMRAEGWVRRSEAAPPLTPSK